MDKKIPSGLSGTALGICKIDFYEYPEHFGKVECLKCENFIVETAFSKNPSLLEKLIDEMSLALVKGVS